MNWPTCPKCRVHFGSEFSHIDRIVDCPYCGKNPVDSSDIGDVKSKFDAAALAFEIPLAIRPFAALRVPDSTLLVRIPPGFAHIIPIGFAMVIWNGMVITGSYPFVSKMLETRINWVVFGFLSLTWIAGLWLVWYWVTMQFTRVYLMLEPGRLIAERRFLGRRWTTETFLSRNACARVVQAYYIYHMSVKHIAIDGRTRDESFGSAMSADGQSKLIEILNDYFTSIESEGTNRPQASLTIRLPESSRIEVAAFNESQLRVNLSSGSTGTRGSAPRALAWNGVMCLIIVSLISKGADLQRIPTLVQIIFALLCLVGLALIYHWIRLRFTRAAVDLTPDRLHVENSLFGWTSQTETSLNSGSCAVLSRVKGHLSERFYKISVSGEERTVQFGASLDDAEKEWLIATINRFLRRDEGHVEKGSMQDSEIATGSDRRRTEIDVADV